MEYIKSLATEYLLICSMMQSGEYDGADYAELSSQRTNTHDQLIQALGPGHEREVFDMKAYCRSLIPS